MGRSKLLYARLKPFHPTPMSEESAEQLLNYQEDRFSPDPPGSEAALPEADHNDGSVQSSYHPLDVDLDDDAIMV